MPLTDPKTADVGGQTLSYFEMGAGPLVICLHGYPDTAHTWEDLLPALADAGFRAVAPFMRGYHPSPPSPSGDYSGIALGRDALGLMKALGETSTAIVGHDWGALAAYSATMQAEQAEQAEQPEQAAVRALVTLAIPHPRAIKPSIRGLWKARHFIAYQFKSRAVKRLEADDYAHVRDIIRRWAPTWTPPDDEIERSKACFRNDGVAEAALGYYWSWRADQGDPEARKALVRRIGVPTLAIGGKADGALLPGTYEATPSCYTGHYEMTLLDGVGHFPHREAPDKVIPRIVEFLAEHGRG